MYLYLTNTELKTFHSGHMPCEIRKMKCTNIASWHNLKLFKKKYNLKGGLSEHSGLNNSGLGIVKY